MKKPTSQQKQIVLFEEKEVRRTWHDEQWYFSVSDVVQVLTDSNDVKQYIKKMRTRDEELSVNWGTICTPLFIFGSVTQPDKSAQQIIVQIKNIEDEAIEYLIGEWKKTL